MNADFVAHRILAITSRKSIIGYSGKMDPSYYKSQCHDALFIATQMDDKETTDWVISEIHGYSNFKVPDYRIIDGIRITTGVLLLEDKINMAPNLDAKCRVIEKIGGKVAYIKVFRLKNMLDAIETEIIKYASSVANKLAGQAGVPPVEMPEELRELFNMK